MVIDIAPPPRRHSDANPRRRPLRVGPITIGQPYVALNLRCGTCLRSAVLRAVGRRPRRDSDRPIGAAIGPGQRPPNGNY